MEAGYPRASVDAVPPELAASACGVCGEPPAALRVRWWGAAAAPRQTAYFCQRHNADADRVLRMFQRLAEECPAP